MEKAEYISLTSDVWTANKTTSFLNDFNHYVACLRAMIPVPGHHTGENLSEEINTALQNFSIAKATVHAIVTDGGTNMVAAACKSCLKHQLCFIHGLQRQLTQKFFHNEQSMIILQKIGVFALFQSFTTCNK